MKRSDIFWNIAILPFCSNVKTFISLYFHFYPHPLFRSILSLLLFILFVYNLKPLLADAVLPRINCCFCRICHLKFSNAKANFSLFGDSVPFSFIKVRLINDKITNIYSDSFIETSDFNCLLESVTWHNCTPSPKQINWVFH